MTEAVNLFQGICSNSYFASSSIILFLNKKDLFAEKLAVSVTRRALCWCFVLFLPPVFRRFFFVLFFVQFNAANTAKKTVYHHVTCATDSENIEVVFNSCKDTVLRINFR
ncbi:unnamed protein product, partial [Ectocarpus sp. 8 AP-2014]